MRMARSARSPTAGPATPSARNTVRMFSCTVIHG